MAEAPECIPFFENADRLTGQCTAPVVGCRFVTSSANLISGPGIPVTAQVGASDPVDGGNIQVSHAPAGSRPLGVSTWTEAEGGDIGIITEGVVPVLAGANLNPGQVCAVGAEGKAVAMAAEGSAASLETGVVANNNRIKFTAVVPGAHAGLKIVLAVAGNNTPLSVSVAGEVVTVHVATGGAGEALSTAAQVIAAVNASAAASALMTAANGGASNGTGVVAAVAETALAGGTLPTEPAGLVVNGATSGTFAMVKLLC